MLDLDESSAVVVAGLVLGVLLLLDSLLGASLGLLGRGLVGVVRLSSRGLGLLALGGSGLLRGWLGGASLAQDLLPDLYEGDGGRIGVLEAGHLGKLLVVDLVCKTVNHSLVPVSNAVFA